MIRLKAGLGNAVRGFIEAILKEELEGYYPATFQGLRNARAIEF